MRIPKAMPFALSLFLGTAWLLWLTLIVRLPADDSFGLVLSLLILAHWLLGSLAWHLLLRPMKVPVPELDLLPNSFRAWLGIALAIGLFAIGIGTAWDEIWHLRFGIPFGADFYWFPHILMYLGLGISASSAFLSAYLIFYRAKGTLQQRFRSDALLGWNLIAGIYTFAAVLLDPFWHWLYGLDLTAWSLPHGVLLLMDLFIGLSAIAFINSSFPRPDWSYLRASWRNLWLGLLFLGMLLCFAVVLMVDVYRPTATMIADVDIPKRPVWVMMSMMSLFTVFMAVLALFISRQIGFATMLVSVLIVLRYMLDHSLDSGMEGAISLWLMLAPTIGIEALAAQIFQREGRRIHWGAAGLIAGILANLINLPVFLALYSMQDTQLLDLSSKAISLIILSNLCAGFIAAWLGKNIAGAINAYSFPRTFIPASPKAT